MRYTDEDARMRKQHAGFTLIELMIVVGIIAILAALAMPNYQDRLIRAQVTESVAFIEFARDAVESFRAKTHRMPANNIEAGLPAASDIIGNYITQVEIQNGVINVQFGNRSNPAIAGKWLSLRPGVVATANQVPISWRCGTARPVDGLTYSGTDRTDLSPQALPIDCRL
jgi:type IV pilus assembly protein PilA